MKIRGREPGPFLLSVAVHVVVAIAILNAAFHYNFSGVSTGPRNAPVQERVTYVTTAPRGGVSGGLDSSVAPARAKEPLRGIVAPKTVPTSISPVAPPAAGSPGGVDGGQGRAGVVGPTVGITPGQPDPRLGTDVHEFFPAPKTHAERVDSAVRASIYAYNDSVARAAGMKGREPGDWTFKKGDQKWGIDGSKIYLGKFAIPSAVLAALPIRIQGNPGEGLTDRLAPTRRADILLHGEAQLRDDEFNTAVKRIRERKDRERKEKEQATQETRAAGNPDIVP